MSCAYFPFPSRWGLNKDGGKRPGGLLWENWRVGNNVKTPELPCKVQIPWQSIWALMWSAWDPCFQLSLLFLHVPSPSVFFTPVPLFKLSSCLEGPSFLLLHVGLQPPSESVVNAIFSRRSPLTPWYQIYLPLLCVPMASCSAMYTIFSLFTCASVMDTANWL